MAKGWQSFEDSNFVAGDSPVTLDVAGELTRPADDGYIACDGTGSIQVEIAVTAENLFGDPFTVKTGEVVTLGGSSKTVRVQQIRITHLGTDSAYRVLVVGF
jgi:uncharacterized protein YdeI (BOF family)